MAATVQINSRRLEKALRTVPKALYKRLREAGRTRVGPRYLAFHRAKRLSGMKAGGGVKGTKRGLKSQFAVKMSGATINTLTLKMYTRSYIAKEHEEGRRIFAKKGKYLVIPMDGAKSKSGKVTKVARRLLKARKLFLIRRKDNKAFLARYQRGKGKKRLVFMFHLVGRAQLKPRLQFRQLWPQYRSRMIREYNRAVGQALKSATGKGAA